MLIVMSSIAFGIKEMKMFYRVSLCQVRNIKRLNIYRVQNQLLIVKVKELEES